jgi:hypothetical protein
VCVKTIYANYHEISRKFVCVKTNFANYHEISRKINTFREKDKNSRMFVCVYVCVKTIFAYYHEFSRKINKFFKKDETSRILVCGLRRISQITTKLRKKYINFAKKTNIRECLCVWFKTNLANYHKISRKIYKFREKD